MNHSTIRATQATPSLPAIAAALARLEGKASQAGALHGAPAGAPAPSPVHRYAIDRPFFAATYYEMTG